MKNRDGLIAIKWKDELYKYITGVVRNKNQKLIAINGMPDHVQVLLGIKPDCSISEMVRDIKANSSRSINEKKWVTGKFEWQNGFGAFTLGHPQLGAVASYIENQEEHHRKRTFREEYEAFLKEHLVDFNPEYLFHEV